MTFIWIGVFIIVLASYPFLLLAKALGFIDVSWLKMLSPILLIIAALALFILGVVGVILFLVLLMG